MAGKGRLVRISRSAVADTDNTASLDALRSRLWYIERMHIKRIRLRGWTCWAGAAATFVLLSLMANGTHRIELWPIGSQQPASIELRLGEGCVGGVWTTARSLSLTPGMNIFPGASIGSNSWDSAPQSPRGSRWLPDFEFASTSSRIYLPFWFLSAPLLGVSWLLNRRIVHGGRVWFAAARGFAWITALAITSTIIAAIPRAWTDTIRLFSGPIRTGGIISTHGFLGLVIFEHRSWHSLMPFDPGKLAISETLSWPQTTNVSTYGLPIQRRVWWGGLTIDRLGNESGRIWLVRAWIPLVIVSVPSITCCWRTRRIAVTESACTRCGYDLVGQTVAGCPECGLGRESTASA